MNTPHHEHAAWRIVLTGVLAGCIVAWAPACSTRQRVRTETTLAKVMISDEQASRLGASIHQDMQDQGVRFVTDPVVTEYIHDIAGRIVPLAKEDRPGIDFSVYVIDDPEQVNAFATPGGYLYLYSGLLLTAENEAEVAGVLGHEAAHISRRHIERQMVNAYGLNALISMALGNDPGRVQAMAADIAATGVLAAHSRSEETEADERGAVYSSEAGYDPLAMVTFFRKLQQLGGGGGPAFLRTHPTDAQRIDNLTAFIRENDLGGGELDKARHQDVTVRIASR